MRPKSRTEYCKTTRIGHNHHDANHRESASPWQELGYAIIQQAVTDVRGLHEAGVLIGTRPVANWPQVTRKDRPVNKTYLHGYKSHQSVASLVEFFQAGLCEELLHALQSTIHADAIQDEIFPDRNSSELAAIAPNPATSLAGGRNYGGTNNA